MSHVVVIVLHLHLDLCVDVTHVLINRTGLGFLDEKGEHGGTVTEFVEGLVSVKIILFLLRSISGGDISTGNTYPSSVMT